MAKKKSLLDKYFNMPVFADYFLGIIVMLSFYILEHYNVYDLPKHIRSASISTDIATVGLTISGFVFTIIAILLSFKSTQALSKNDLTNNSSPFEIFLASGLFSKSIIILRDGVLSLLFISVGIYLFKILLNENCLKYLFYCNLLGLLIIILTFGRCFYVLDIIFKLQKTT